MRRLAILDPLLNSFNVRFNVAVGDENVRPAIKVKILKIAGKTQAEETGAADLGAWCLVHEQAIAFVVVERNHLVGEIADDDRWPSTTIVVSRVYTHARTRHAVFAESYTGGKTFFRKRAVLVVDVELVGLRVIGDQDVGPAVGVYVQNSHPQALGRRIVKP